MTPDAFLSCVLLYVVVFARSDNRIMFCIGLEGQVFAHCDSCIYKYVYLCFV